MHAEVLAIGDEVAGGQLLDTNSQWLSQRLEEIGIRVLYHATVGDELGPLAEVFREAARRSDVVIATGGLGPTADDLTRHAMAEAAGRALVLDAGSLEHIRQLFARRGRIMAAQNERQALFPEGSRPIPNPHGTAPGIAMEVARPGKGPCRLFALPGVSAEMREMWHATVLPALRGLGRGRVVKRRVIKCFGAGESNVEAMLPDLIRRGRTPTVGINASQTTILLRILAEGASEPECDALIESTAATIRACLGSLVFGEGDDELQDAVGRLLRDRKQTLATAEWGTGGTIAHWMNDAPDAQGPYRGGVVVAGEAALLQILGVPAGHSIPTAESTGAMAASCRRMFAADLGLAVGPFPAFDPAAPEPQPVFVGLARSEGVEVTPFPYAGHPATLKVYCAKQALNVVRLALTEDRRVP